MRCTVNIPGSKPDTQRSQVLGAIYSSWRITDLFSMIIIYILMELISDMIFAVFSEHWRFCYQQLGMHKVDLWYVDLLFVEVDLLVAFNLRLLDVHCIWKWSCWILLSVSIYGLLISISDLIIFSFPFPICISRQLRIQFN